MMLQGSRQQSRSNPERPSPSSQLRQRQAAAAEMLLAGNAPAPAGAGVAAGGRGPNGRSQGGGPYGSDAGSNATGVSVSLMALPRPPGGQTPDRGRYGPGGNGGSAGAGAPGAGRVGVGVGGRDNNGSLPARPPATPETLDAFVRVTQQLSAKDWRERTDALKTVEAGVSDLPGACRPMRSVYFGALCVGALFTDAVYIGVLLM